MLQDEGIDMLSVHARLKKESFARKPRWECIAGIKEKLTIPVIANGGIFSVEDAAHCLRFSGRGRPDARPGAQRSNPGFLLQSPGKSTAPPVPEPAVSLPAIYRDLSISCESFRPEYRLGRLKQFTHYFAQNYQFGHHLASRVQSSNSVDEARERAEVFFAEAQKRTCAGKRDGRPFVRY